MLARLQAHSWPGNVRELENLLLRACALRPSLRRLELEDLGALFPAASQDPAAALLAGGNIVLPPDGISFDEIERRLLTAAWEQSGHNQTRGAKLLGLPRQAFIYRLQKIGILHAYGEEKE